MATIKVVECGPFHPRVSKDMDRTTCISMLMLAGITWSAATWYFHDDIAWRDEQGRRDQVEHLCSLVREDAQLRSEE